MSSKGAGQYPRAEYSRRWRERHPEKQKALEERAKNNPVRKAYYKSWLEENRHKKRAYSKMREALNGEARQAYLLKSLKPEDSIFKAFYALDSKPEFENVISNQLNPYQMLELKERALNAN